MDGDAVVGNRVLGVVCPSGWHAVDVPVAQVESKVPSAAIPVFPQRLPDCLPRNALDDGQACELPNRLVDDGERARRSQQRYSGPNISGTYLGTPTLMLSFMRSLDRKLCPGRWCTQPDADA